MPGRKKWVDVKEIKGLLRRNGAKREVGGSAVGLIEGFQSSYRGYLNTLISEARSKHEPDDQE